jgi:predicted Zn-dependent protease
MASLRRAHVTNRPVALAKRVGLLAFVCLVSVGCSLFRSEGRPRSPLPLPSPPSSRIVYFMPIGDFPVSDTQALVAHYQAKFDLTVEILPSIEIPDEAVDSARKQLIAERLIDAIGAARDVSSDPTAIVIGLTSTDMYIADLSWRYAFGLRANDHLAVVSTARMTHFFHFRTMRRLEKMITRDIGILYFGLPLNDDPGSVLYRDIGGPNDLDNMSEDF